MAFQRGSRYEYARRFVPDSERASFPGTRPRDIVTPEGILEHVVQAGTRLDLLALHYYGDDRKWWRIVDANPSLLHAGDVTLDDIEGQVLLIPRAPGSQEGT